MLEFAVCPDKVLDRLRPLEPSVYRDIKMKQQTSEFVGITGADEPTISVTATLKAKALQAIATDVQAMLQLLFNEQDRGEATS